MREQQTTQYFLYARKSSESDEKQLQSIDDQVEYLTELAQRKGLHIVDTISESKSAKAPYERIEFENMMQRIKKGEAQGILTWKIDRLARNPIDGGALQWLLQQEIITSILTPTKEYLSSDNTLIFSIESSMATQYVRELSMNVKRGMDGKVKKGWKPSIAPIGYKNTKTLERGENYIVKDPERFELVKKAWKLLLSKNYTPTELLHIMNNKWGFRTRKSKKKGDSPIGKSTIYKLFTNPFYAGLFTYKGKLHKGKHVPMISIEEYDQAQKILGVYSKLKIKQHEYAYTGNIKCGECGGVISATYKLKRVKTTGKLKEYTLYYCTTASSKKNTCSQRKYLNVAQIEETIEKELANITIHPVIADVLLQTLTEQKANKITVENIAEKNQNMALVDIRRQLQNLTQMRLKDFIDDSEFQKEKNILAKEEIRLQTQIKKETPKEDSYVLCKQAILFSTYAHRKFITGSTKTKKKILNTLSHWNCTLKDKTLLINKPKWLLSIEEMHPSLLAHFKALELEIPIHSKTKMLFDLLRPDLCSLVDCIRTEINNSTNHPNICTFENETDKITDEQKKK